MILSGDAHWSGVFKVQKGVYEVSNSPIDAFPVLAPKVAQGPDETVTIQSGHRYVNKLTVDTKAPIPYIQYLLFDVDGESHAPPIFQRRLSITDLS